MLQGSRCDGEPPSVEHRARLRRRATAAAAADGHACLRAARPGAGDRRRRLLVGVDDVPPYPLDLGGPARPATGARAVLAGKQPSDPPASQPVVGGRRPLRRCRARSAVSASQRSARARIDSMMEQGRASIDRPTTTTKGLCWALHRPRARSSSARHPARRSLLLLLLRACPLPTGDGTSGRSTASSSRQTGSGGTELRRRTRRRRCFHGPRDRAGRAKKSSECRRRRTRSPSKRAAAGRSDPSSGG